ncbi:hypothetical protein [Paraburkholderia sp. BL17N1]|uniref:hypothetical protein n=1 Tax=Paraburkholderia sp. BL17N1 TaxID=1938798 RepID=UPI000EB4938F|nr:hypothetical protein [Paraburkholderia sp. BL17N1]RKR36843.1 hypothetical protein B0G82_4897 [Paraburkholderia sp. BL17N1]
MKVTKGIFISALFVAISGSAYAQGAGGGAAAGQGGTGMSKPNANSSTDTVSGATGTNSMATSGATSNKKMMHKKPSAATPASATNPGSGGN